MTAIVACKTTESVEQKKATADKLTARLQQLQKKGYMVGHQDAPFYGVSWEWDKDRCDIKESVGDYPAVMGFDLGGIEMGDKKNLDSVPFTRIHEELIRHHERGGIVTVSWHPRNPLTGGTAWDVTSDQVVKSVLAGGSQYDKFQLWMKRVSDYLLTMKDSKGKAVPIIFRPWHENNGSWFWWGQKLCTDEEFHGLWNMLQDYLTQRGLTNLVWSYSPNLYGDWDEVKFLVRYPGDDRVTLIGEDAYQWGTKEDFEKQIISDLNFLWGFSRKHGKLFALTECGYKNMPDPTWWSSVLKPIMDKRPLSYFLLWRNYKQEYFGPTPSRPELVEDFKVFHDADNVLFLEDIKH